MLGAGVHSPEDRRFVGLASGVLDDILARDPAHATRIGDHRFDARLPDLTADGVAETTRVLQRHAAFLANVDARALSRFAAADLTMLREGVAQRLFDLTVVRRHEWDPLVWNPSPALAAITQHDFAPAGVRARSLVARLEAIPEFLDNARHTLGPMPGLASTTAAAQMRNTGALLRESLGDLADEPGVTEAAATAVEAIDRHCAWLQAQPDARSVALGPEVYGGILTHHLGQGPDPDADELLAAAEDDLERVLDQIASVAARFQRGTMADRSVVTDALQRMAADFDVTDDTVLDRAAEALQAGAEFVSARDLVTVPAMDLRLELMPPVFRGISVATCEAPGALEPKQLPTVIRMAPPPEHWDAQRRQSYYREYNLTLLYNLMVHEGVPGHALQQAHARAAAAPTAVRAAMPSGLFVEGWAVYAEEMMAHRGFVVAAQQRSGLHLQQLKMQLRTILNTILDIRVHTRGMTEAEARRLLATKGFQEDGEIAGKWVRAQLSAGQLSTYYVGYQGVASVVNDLDEDRRDWSIRQVHDAVLAHGSVPPHVLRSLVGLE